MVIGIDLVASGCIVAGNHPDVCSLSLPPSETLKSPPHDCYPLPPVSRWGLAMVLDFTETVQLKGRARFPAASAG